MINASIIPFIKKFIGFNKKNEVYNNGAENNAPYIVEELINASVTARLSSNLMTQFLIGKGFGDADDIIINSSQRLYDFTEEVAKDKVNQSGVFIWIGWGLETGSLKISEMKVLPYANCRVGKQDDKEYSGKIVYFKDVNDKKDKGVIFDVYNEKENVVLSQVKKAGGWQKYKGQVLFISDENRKIYPTSRLEGSVGLDAENEIQIARYKNQILKHGFFGKQIIITKPLIDRNVPKEILNENGELSYNLEYSKLETARENFKNTIVDFCGAEKVGGALHIEIDFDHEDIDKQILFKNIESNINPDMFANIEKSCVENICKGFNNLPIGLVQHSAGGLNASGEQIKELKKMYWENTEKERNQLERAINLLWKNHINFNAQYLKIKPYEFIASQISQ